MKIVYHPGYNIDTPTDHPFDSRKYGRAWNLLSQEHSSVLDRYWHKPEGPVSREDLLRVHSSMYLDSLTPRTLGSILGYMPQISEHLVHELVLKPIQLAVQGTIDAAVFAMTEGAAINLGGGFHHAYPNYGGGFCVYADVAIAVDVLRDRGLLSPGDKIAYIDVDAHFGDGVAGCFQKDPDFRILDIHGFFLGRQAKSSDIYLCVGHREKGRSYLERLRKSLKVFLDQDTKLAIVNAGTDPFEGDKLGDMHLSYDEMVERDRMILDALNKRGYNWFLVTSGGYSNTSYRLLAETASYALHGWEAKASVSCA